MSNGLDRWEAYFTEEDKAKSSPIARRIFIVAPMTVETGEEFSVRLSAMRADGYPALDFQHKMEMKALNDNIEGLPRKVIFAPEDRGIKEIDGLKMNEEGFAWIALGSDGKDLSKSIGGLSNPILARKKFERRIYWGDLHVHSSCGDCHRDTFKSPDYGYWFGRYVMGLDYVAMSDHASNMLRLGGQWEKILKAAKEHYASGEFVTFPGFETDYRGEDGGHFNIYFNSDDAPLKHFSDETMTKFTVRDIFDFTRKHNAIAISHHNARNVRGRDYSKSVYGEDAEPLVEIYSKWGSSEAIDNWRPVREGIDDPVRYYREALKRGYKLGVIGGTDDHNTCPASYMHMRPFNTPFYAQPGMGAVIAERKDRDSIWSALKARRTYATSANRVYADFQIDGHAMGEEIHSRAPHLKLTLAASGNFRFVEIYKNEELLFKTSGEWVVETEMEDKGLDRESYYFVRAETTDNERVWLSPIWVAPE